MGLPMIVSDRVARHPENTRSLVAYVMRVRIAVSVVAGLLLFGMYRLGTSATLAVPLFMTISIAASTVYTTATAALRGMGSVVPDSVNEIASRTLVLGLGWWLLHSGHGIGAAACVLATADVLSAIVLTWVLWRRTTTGVAFPGEIVHWRAVVPLSMALLISTLHTRIDVWLLAVIGSASDVAHYAIPAKVAEGLLLPAGVAAVLVIPLTAALGDVRARGRRALAYVLAVAGVVAIGGLVVGLWAHDFLTLAFGKGYGRDGGVLRLLCLSDIPTAISVGLAPIVAILHRRALLRWVAVALVVNVVMNLALLPHYRGVGAAWASIVSMTVVSAGLVVTVLRLPGRTEATA
jgi:O-antigen/teichoic acid export membrane protein